MGKRIYLSSPHMSDEGYEMQYIQEAFDTNWIAPLGKNVDEFEKELAAKVGVGHAAALASGTAAIHMALKAAGVGEGDIVFCQDLTFAASANPIIFQNATPVFIDGNLETWNMDPDALEEAFEKYLDNRNTGYSAPTAYLKYFFMRNTQSAVLIGYLALS
jgi:dTDP-4-amino-4,6-dideoxygalactose transaminase